MASISSKLYQYVPPFLRALNLSNQSFSFHQNSKVPIINDHCPAIHTKPPSLPLPLFLTRNPSFGHFLSKATTTTRMPLDEQPHCQPSCLDHIHTNNLFSKKSVEANNPLTVHSFSLMHMWMELEEEARLCPLPHSGMTVTSPTPIVEEHSTCLDACEMFKFFEKEITENVPIAALFPSPMLSPSPSQMSFTGDALKLTERKGMEYFSLKLEEERRREVAVIGELHPVSQFPFLGRIQLLIKMKSLRQELAIVIYQQLSENLRERFGAGSHNFLLRELDLNQFPSEESGDVMEIQLFDSHFSVLQLPIDHSNGETNQYFLELISSREIESPPPEAFYSLQTFFTQPFGQKDQHNRRSLEASWDGKSFWWSYLDWQKSLYCHMMQTWHNEATFMRKKWSSHKQYVASIKRNCPLQPSTIRKGCG